MQEPYKTKRDKEFAIRDIFLKFYPDCPADNLAKFISVFPSGLTRLILSALFINSEFLVRVIISVCLIESFVVGRKCKRRAKE